MTTRFRLPRLLEKHQGFSIIELITAVVIIAVMALIAVAVFRNFRESASVKAAAREVASTMRLARQKAITNREDYYAVYDITNNKVWVQPASTYPPKNPDPGTEHPLPDRAIIDSVTSGGSDPLHKHHTFTPRSTSSSGSVKLKDEKQRLEYSVRLVSTTARARIYDSWP